MRLIALSPALIVALALAFPLVAQTRGGDTTAVTQSEAGFTPLFDGKSLAGWSLIGGKGEGYGVKDGVLYCAKGGGASC